MKEALGLGYKEGSICKYETAGQVLATMRMLISAWVVSLGVNIWWISVKVGGPLSSGGPEGDDEGLSLVNYWPKK